MARDQKKQPLSDSANTDIGWTWICTFLSGTSKIGLPPTNHLNISCLFRKDSQAPSRKPMERSIITPCSSVCHLRLIDTIIIYVKGNGSPMRTINYMVPCLLWSGRKSFACVRAHVPSWEITQLFHTRPGWRPEFFEMSNGSSNVSVKNHPVSLFHSNYSTLLTPTESLVEEGHQAFRGASSLEGQLRSFT